jgi:hypothetical protein
VTVASIVAAPILIAIGILIGRATAPRAPSFAGLKALFLEHAIPTQESPE